MKHLILALLLPLTLFGQAVNRRELIQTNDLIRGATVANKDGLATNLTVRGIRSSDGTPGFDAITGGVTFRDGIYTGGEIFGTNWVTNAVSAIYSNGVVKGTNINALNLARGPDVIFQVNSGAVQAVSVTGLVINTTGSGGLVRSNAPNLHAPTLDGTNLTDQIDAQINASDALILQSATNYANSVTNSSIVRQTQATALSNALVSLAYSIGTDATNFSLLASNAVRLVAGLDATNHANAILQSATNYANAVTNSSLVRQTQLNLLSNLLMSLSYTIGANSTNYTLTASNGVRIVAGLDATNHAEAILQSSTNYTLVASNNVRLVVGLDETNHANAILQSATNYANSVTNASIVRQTQATTLSNAVVSLAYSIGADATNFTLTASNAVRLVAGLAATNHANAILQAATNYANGVTNASIARQTQLTALSNALIAFSYSIGSDATNYTLTASNNVRLVAGLAATNHANAILASSTNFTRAYAQPLGTSAITTNGNQFGASVTITIKDGAFVTNVVNFGQTNVGNADFSRGLTNYSTTLPVQSAAGFTSGNGTEYGVEGFLDPSTGFLLWFGVTNVFATMTNRYVADHLPSPGDCWKIKSTNGYEILWTNGPCGGGGSEIWTTNSLGYIVPVTAANFVAMGSGYRPSSPSFSISYDQRTNGEPAETEMYFLNTATNDWIYASMSQLVATDGANDVASWHHNVELENAEGEALSSQFLGTISAGFHHVTWHIFKDFDNTTPTNTYLKFDDGNLFLLDALSISGQTNRYSDDGSQLLRDGVPVVRTNATVVQIITNLFVDNITIQKGGTFVGTQFVNITVVTNIYGSITAIASNAASFQLDFTPGVGTTHYQMTNMANNFTIQLTNLYTDSYGPRDAWFYFETDSTGSRTVTVSTNGLTTGTRVSWGWSSITNGATSFTVTNRARLNLVRNRAGVISAAYEFQQ